MKKNLRATITLAVLAGLALTAAADTLYLRNGEQEDGVLKKMTAEALTFQGPNGEKTWPVKDVERVQLQRPRKYDDAETISQIDDTDLKACVAHQPSEKDYPADGSVTLLQRHTYDLATPGVVKETDRNIVKVLRQRGEAVGSQNVFFYDDTDTAAIDFALTITPDGHVLHLSDSALKDESIYARCPEYRRLSRLRFACKEPRPSSVLDVQTTTERKRDPVLEPFYTDELFGSDAPILRKEVVVLIPAAREKELVFEVFKGEAIEQKREETNGVVRLAWTLKTPQPGIVQEPLMPPKSEFVPHVTMGLAASWADSAKAYAAKLASVAPLPDALKEKAVDLAKKGGAEAIYNFVVRGIRTAPVPQGHYSLLPHAPGETAARGLANELDKNFLFCKMLEAAGVPCALALVKDRAQGPAAAVPSLRAFDRTAVLLEKDDAYITTASDLLPFGVLPGEMQGAPALAIKAGTKGLVTMPIPNPNQELDNTAFTARLNADGNLDMTIVHTGTGNTVAWMRSFKDLDEQELKNRLQQIVSNIHPAAMLKDFKKSDFADLTVPPSLTITCAIPGFAVKAGDLMLLNIPTAMYEAGDVGRPTREHDLFWDHIARGVSNGKIELPKGFKIYSLPASVKFDSTTVAYRASLKKKGRRTVTFDEQFDLKVDQAPKAAYADYKKAKEMRADMSRQRIILMRK